MAGILLPYSGNGRGDLTISNVNIIHNRYTNEF